MSKQKISIVLCNNMHMDIENANLLLNHIIGQRELDVTNDYTVADIIVVITCAFGPNKLRSIKILADITVNRKENAHVIVTGCMLKTDYLELSKIGFELIEFNKLLEKFSINSKVTRILPQNKVVISNGCLKKCTYCVYPNIYPKYESKPIEQVIDEVKEMYETEPVIYITGALETSDYGIDIYGKRCFHELLDKVTTEYPNSTYVIGWFHPFGLTDEVISVIERHKNIAEIMLHIQHVSPKILKAMNRPNYEFTDERIRKLKKKRHDIKISTEVIVGFPGESENEYINLLKYLQKGYFADIGVASYEPVKGTIASRLEERIPSDVKKLRMECIQNGFNATSYPECTLGTDSSLTVEYLSFVRIFKNLPGTIFTPANRSYAYHLIAGTDTEFKLESMANLIESIVQMLTDSRDEFEFEKNYKFVQETYSKEARSFLMQIISELEECKSKPKLHKRLTRLML